MATLKLTLKNSAIKGYHIFKIRLLKEKIMIVESKFPVAQNGRFVIYPVYPRGGTMVAKILDFGLFESLKMHSPGPFALSNYP